MHQAQCNGLTQPHNSPHLPGTILWVWDWGRAHGDGGPGAHAKAWLLAGHCFLRVDSPTIWLPTLSFFGGRLQPGGSHPPWEPASHPLVKVHV